MWVLATASTFENSVLCMQCKGHKKVMGLCKAQTHCLVLVPAVAGTHEG